MSKRRILIILTFMILHLIACSGNDHWNEESDGENYSGRESSENIIIDQLLEDMIETRSDIQPVDRVEENEIICDNPYFFSSDVSSLTADIRYCDFEGFATIRGDLELHWLKQYENGCVAKLSLLPFDNIPEYLLNESVGVEYAYCDIYFYVTSDEIYRVNSYIIQDGEYVYAHENESLFIELLDSDEKIIENAELVCCLEGIESDYAGENICEEIYIGEIGTHYEIALSENQITYRRHEYPDGHLELYNTFVWEKGRGLVEHKRGYRAEAMILYLENITIE